MHPTANVCFWPSLLWPLLSWFVAGIFCGCCCCGHRWPLCGRHCLWPSLLNPVCCVLIGNIPAVVSPAILTTYVQPTSRYSDSSSAASSLAAEAFCSAVQTSIPAGCFAYHRSGLYSVGYVIKVRVNGPDIYIPQYHCLQGNQNVSSLQCEVAYWPASAVGSAAQLSIAHCPNEQILDPGLSFVW